jgi:hypothetical protein
MLKGEKILVADETQEVRSMQFLWLIYLQVRGEHIQQGC